eukprot:5590693-Pleurochrysis_carterae.AAC.6
MVRGSVVQAIVSAPGSESQRHARRRRDRKTAIENFIEILEIPARRRANSASEIPIRELHRIPGEL